MFKPWTSFMTATHRVLARVSLVACCVGLAACSGNQAVKRLNGAGATFPAKIYQNWFADLAQSGGSQVNYQAVGSGSGRRAFLDQTVDFAASDDPIKAVDRDQVERGVVQIPMVGGTIAFGYNKPGCDLKLTQQQAVQVAIGKITNWKDLGCEAGTITWVHRSDGSGTTKAFTNSMQAFSPEWTLGTGKSVQWPVGVGGKGNSGVAGVIENREGAIGYVNQSFIKGNVVAAALENKSGEFLKPSVESGAISLNSIQLDQYLAGTNPNPTNKGAYPIATLTWDIDVLNYMLSIPKKQGFVPLKGDILKAADKTSAIKDVLNYMLSDLVQRKAFFISLLISFPWICSSKGGYLEGF